MKNLIFILGIIVSISLSSCSDEFLEKNPSNTLVSDNFYQKESDAIAGVNGVYQALQWPNNYNFRYWTLDFVAGNAVVGAGGGSDGGETTQMINFVFQADNPAIDDIWRGIWPAVARANLVIDGVSKMSIDKDFQARIIAEAKFLRAVIYFNGVRLFGPLPVIPEVSDELFVKRASLQQTYDFIIGDLTISVNDLPVNYDGSKNNEVGRATKGAAMALLMKAYLTVGEYDLAEQVGINLIALNRYKLNPDYAQNFDPNNENGQESIFEIQYAAGKGENPFSSKLHQGSWSSEFTNPRGSGLSAGGGYGWGHVTQEFVNTYESGDSRLSVNIWRDGDVYGDFTYDASTYSTTGYNIKKWVQGSNLASATDSDLNMPVLRYADVLLMMAEAINEQSRPVEAAQYLEMVRNRAGLFNDMTALSESEMREAIIHERRIELAFEGHWWYDLMRAGPDYAESFFNSIGRSGFDKTQHVLFPISQADIDLNPNL